MDLFSTHSSFLSWFQIQFEHNLWRSFFWLLPDQDFEQKTRKMAMPLTLYAPMRDGDLNDAMVGLFSDWRVWIPGVWIGRSRK